MLPRNLTIISLVLIVSTACHLLQRRTRTSLVVGEALELIERFYVEPIDERQLILSALNGMTSTLDQHSEFIPPQQYQSFQDSIQQEFAGIGIYVDQPQPDQPVRVITPLVGSPAIEAGLLPGDLIIEIDGEVVAGLGMRDVSDRLRGPIGTQVSLRLKRGEQDIHANVVRDRIELESVIGDHRDENNDWVYRLEAKPQVAYVRMTSFGDKTVRELEKVLTQLDNDFDALVLDLRGNGGGLLTAAVDVADMFLDRGIIVSTKIRGGVVEEEAYATPGTLVDPAIPIGILMDHDSASASEIVAAALQDHSRAIVGGTRSFGKGTVQNILPLEYGRSALRLTVAKYYRPSGLNIHRGKDDEESDVWGVVPNEGLATEIETPDLEKLTMLWQEASYPSLKGLDRNAFLSQMIELTEEQASPEEDAAESATDAKQSPKSEPDRVTVWELDRQLVRVVERLIAKQDGDSSLSPDSSNEESVTQDSKQAA